MNLYEQIGEKNIDLLIDILYDEIIANDERINVLFHTGFHKVKEEQKKFFRIFLGAPTNIMQMPNLKEKHSPFPITPEVAKYWVEDFEIAINRLEIDDAIKTFLYQKVRMLGMHMINTFKN